MSKREHSPMRFKPATHIKVKKSVAGTIWDINTLIDETIVKALHLSICKSWEDCNCHCFTSHDEKVGLFFNAAIRELYTHGKDKLLEMFNTDVNGCEDRYGYRRAEEARARLACTHHLSHLLHSKAAFYEEVLLKEFDHENVENTFDDSDEEETEFPQQQELPSQFTSSSDVEEDYEKVKAKFGANVMQVIIDAHDQRIEKDIQKIREDGDRLGCPKWSVEAAVAKYKNDGEDDTADENGDSKVGGEDTEEGPADENIGGEDTEDGAADENTKL